MAVIFKGCASYLPSRVIDNHSLEAIVSTNDEWIVKRTGIHSRRIVTSEKTSDMALSCGAELLQSLNKKHIDAIIVASATPDLTFPSVATIVQGQLLSRLNISSSFAFDIQAACAGFVYAFNLATDLIRCKSAKNALIIGADTLSKIVDWQDRSTCILFGDGAGAVVLEHSPEVTPTGVVATHFRSDGTLSDILKTTDGTSTKGTAGKIAMDGKEVFKHAVSKMSESIEHLLAVSDIPKNAVDWFVLHQANLRILSGIAKHIGAPIEKFASTIAEHGNTSAASIPLALNEYIKTGRIKPGQTLVFNALGAGLTWGGFVLKI